MSKVAFIFPGQGSQSVGMCKDLYDNYAWTKLWAFLSANCVLKAPKTSCA